MMKSLLSLVLGVSMSCGVAMGEQDAKKESEIDKLVARVAKTPGLLINIMPPDLTSPSSAKPEEVVKEYSKKVSWNDYGVDKRIEEFKVLESREVTLEGEDGPEVRHAVHCETNLGDRIFLLEYVKDGEAGQWVVQDLEVPKDAAEAAKQDAEARLWSEAEDRRLEILEAEKGARLEPEVKTLLARLDQIVIPEVNFDQTSLGEAIDFVRVRTTELDPELKLPNGMGISFVVSQPMQTEEIPGAKEPVEVKVPRVTYQGRNVRMLEVVREIARGCKKDAYLTAEGIVLTSTWEKPRRKLEIWKVVRSGLADQEKAFLTMAEVPSVRLDQASAAEALEYLTNRSEERDRSASPGMFRLFRGQMSRWSNLAPPGYAGLQMTDQERDGLPRITYSAVRPLLMDALKEVARQAKLDVYLTTYGMVLKPAGQALSKSEKEQAAKIVEQIYRWEEDEKVNRAEGEKAPGNR